MLQRTLLVVAFACASCAQMPDRSEKPASAETGLEVRQPNYAELRQDVMQLLERGDMDEALALVENLPERPPEGLDSPHELAEFRRLRQIADLVFTARERGVTRMQIRMDGMVEPSFESQPRT